MIENWYLYNRVDFIVMASLWQISANKNLSDHLNTMHTNEKTNKNFYIKPTTCKIYKH